VLQKASLELKNAMAPSEWIIVNKLRLRGVLFNNLSVIIFFTTILVILGGFYLLIAPPGNSTKELPVNLTIRISASLLLIFLVQVLFRVFKYLLRVAGFYNAKADAIEFNQFYKAENQPQPTLEKLMDLFTPSTYDMSDLPSDNLIETIKAKFGK
jgi:hypothetical protein